MFVVDLQKLLESVRRRAAVVLLAAACAAAAAYVLSGFIAPTYESQALVAVVESPVGGGAVLDAAASLASIVGVGSAADPNKKEEIIAKLRSRALLNAFVTEGNLLPELFSGQWDPRTQTWKSGSEAPTLQDAYELIDEQVLRVSDRRRTSLLTISVRWSDPNQAELWVRELIRRVDAEERHEARTRARASIDYLKAEANRAATVEMRQLVYRLMESHLRDEMLASMSPEFVLKVIDPPEAPDKDRAVSPRKSLIAVATAFIVLVLASLWVAWPGITFNARDRER